MRRALVFLLAAFPCLPPVARAELVDAARVATLPGPERAAWSAYLGRSAEAARADREVLQAEVESLGLAVALRAPAGGDFKLPDKVDAAWFASAESGRLAEAIISYQTPAGGWSKHTDYRAGPRKPGMQWTSQSEPGRPFHYVATFDNHSTTDQIRLLAGVWRESGREDCKAAALRGVDFVLAARFPNGGWPQVYPLEGGYHDDITLNDSALTHVLELLLAIERGEPDFAFVDAARRREAARALSAGLACLLRLQVEIGGRKAVWCAQYDALTLAPSSARKMEPAALSGLESAHVLKFLMSIERPSPEVVAAVESGCDWLEQAKVTNVAKRKAGGKTVYQIDPASTEVYWARFYDLRTGRPILPGRDGVVYATYEEMSAKNAGGYDYFTTIPGSVLKNGRNQWRKMLAKQRE